MASHSNSKRLNLIQVFRGVAAVLVLLCHGDLIFQQNLNQEFLYKIFDFGGSGVDFFFVLSGFIIFYIHQSDINNPSRLGTFFTKRFVRIYPIYWVILTTKLLLSFLTFSADANQQNAIEVIKAYLLLPQDRQILSDSFLGVSWTLTSEVFFYFMFSLLIGMRPKISRPIITIWLVGSFFKFMGLLPIPENDPFLQMLFGERNLEFLMGCLAAFLLSRHKIGNGMLLLSIGTFFYTLSAINVYYKVFSLSDVITFGIPSMILVLGAVAFENRKNLDFPHALLLIGDASYSIYLTHGFFLNNFSKVLLAVSPTATQNVLILNVFAVIFSILTTVLGCFFYSFVEKPLLVQFRSRLVTKPSN
ncbi:MAG: acyltransferase [Leptolyngbyaceae cyanobacterium bins.59]|nr:acyltransferase [Leptolyngbyaceae cyanobacterium bins.59]